MQHSKEIPTDPWNIPQTLNHLCMKEILSYMYFVYVFRICIFLRTYIANKWANHQSNCFCSLDVNHITGTKLPHPILPYPYSDSFKICVSSTSPTTCPGSKISGHVPYRHPNTPSEGIWTPITVHLRRYLDV